MHTYFRNYIKAVEKPLPEMAEYFKIENNYLKSLVSKESLVLDVGCGNGRTMKFLSPFVKRIIGIDYDPLMIESSKETLKSTDNTSLILSDFLTYDFKEKFDLVYGSYNILGSAETKDRLGLLKAMLKSANRKGRVVASVWSDKGIEFANKYYPHIGISIKDIRDNQVVTDQGVFKRFSYDELVNLANSVSQDFKIIELTSIFYLIDIKKV